MEPVFAEVALHHEVGDRLVAVALPAVAVYVEKRLVIQIFLVFIGFCTAVFLGLVTVNFAVVWHPEVATVTTKFQFVV